MLLFSSVTQAERLRVGMLCPAPPEENPFWGSVVNVMNAVAQDLDIELIVNCSRFGSLATKRAGNDLVHADPPIDYLVTGYWASVSKHHLAMANANAIKTFVINSSIIQEEQTELGDPRGKLKNWIGHMVPDDKQAAADLTNELVKVMHKSNGPSKEIEIVALLGDGSRAIGRSRTGGLKTQAQALSAVKLHEIPRVHWTIDWARDDVESILHKRTGINVVWGTNSASAWGGLLGAEKAGRKPGKDIFIGGFDWNPESLKAIEDGRISAAMFGHFLEGAWALILVHDYHYGYDFMDDTGINISTPLVAMTPENVAQYKKILDEDFWDKVDFRKFSKKYNPELKLYNFSISQFLKELPVDKKNVSK